MKYLLMIELLVLLLVQSSTINVEAINFQRHASYISGYNQQLLHKAEASKISRDGFKMKMVKFNICLLLDCNKKCLRHVKKFNTRRYGICHNACGVDCFQKHMDLILTCTLECAKLIATNSAFVFGTINFFFNSSLIIIN